MRDVLDLVERGCEDLVGILPGYDEQVTRLINSMKAIAGQFPSVQFAVPESVHVYREWPAAWAFAADGLLSDEQRVALGQALQAL